MKRAVSVSRKKLVSIGTCFGKFNRKGAFKLHVTALTYLAPYATVGRWCISLLILAAA